MKKKGVIKSPRNMSRSVRVMAVPPSWIAKLFILHWRCSQSKEAAISNGPSQTGDESSPSSSCAVKRRCIASQKKLAMLGANLLNPEDLKSRDNVEHFGSGWRNNARVFLRVAGKDSPDFYSHDDIHAGLRDSGAPVAPSRFADRYALGSRTILSRRFSTVKSKRPGIDIVRTSDGTTARGGESDHLWVAKQFDYLKKRSEILHH